MKFKAQYTAFILALSATAVAQKKDENIGTEVVNVVKPYTPTISDAFKVKETPTIEDEDNSKKADIQYNIFSFPVASTFTPSKGRAASVDKTPQEKLFKNFATLALGNYGTINAELFITENITDNSYFGAMLRHISSNGGIKEVELEDSYRNSQIDLTYGMRTDALSWNIDGGFQSQMYNWYGLPEGYLSELAQPDRQDVIDGIDPEHSYQNVYIGTKLSFNESIFNEVTAKFNRFWDSYESAENRFFVKPVISFDVNATKIKTEFVLDYLGGEFKEFFGDLDGYKYGYTNIGVHPSFTVNKDDWSIDLGAAAFYSVAMEGDGDSKFFIYPQINASYKVVGDLMVFYAGAEGTLEQYSYRDMVNENPFIAPIQPVVPTDRQFDVFAGLKGKLANSVSYNIRGSYMNERSKALFKANNYDAPVIHNYDHGNSFGVIYDDVRTISFFGELKADFSKNVSFGINGAFYGYDTAEQEEAWNLPTLKFGSSLDVNITKKWYAGAQVFFVGERKDAQVELDAIEPGDGIKTLKSYFDANFHLGYKHNERLTGFLKLNNIANQQYEKWLNYPVQGIQVLLGASYKFDF